MCYDSRVQNTEPWSRKRRYRCVCGKKATTLEVAEEFFEDTGSQDEPPSSGAEPTSS